MKLKPVPKGAPKTKGKIGGAMKPVKMPLKGKMMADKGAK